MTGQSNEDAFAAFAGRRKDLNESIDAAGKAIDQWLDQSMPPAIDSLRELEALLRTRRDLIAELIALDDEFIVTQLVNSRP